MFEFFLREARIEHKILFAFFRFLLLEVDALVFLQKNKIIHDFTIISNKKPTPPFLSFLFFTINSWYPVMKKYLKMIISEPGLAYSYCSWFSFQGF